MSALYIVLPLALLLVGAAIAAYAWAARRGQFDDLSTPPLRMLHDESEAGEPPEKTAGDEGPDP